MAASSTDSAAVSESWTAVGHTWVETSVASEPAASLASQDTVAEQPNSVDLLLQQRQMAERLRQMEAIVEGQRRAHALEKVRMDLRIAVAEADTIMQGGAAPNLRPSKEFLQSCVRIQKMWRGKAAACRYEIKKRTATKIQAAARRLLAMRQLVAARGAATKLATSARRHAAIVERARLLRERSATRVQAAFRAYKSRVLDAPAVTKSRLIARLQKALRMLKAAEDKAVAAAAAVGSKEAETETGGDAGRGTMRYSNGDYEGGLKAGLPAGRGVRLSANGDVYDGEWKAGKEEGHGVERYADGDVYDGEWKAGKYEGRGVYRHPDGTVYEGEWKAGVREGHGVERYASGNRYDGEFKADMYEGHGVYRHANGNVYAGEFKADEREGRGVERYADGDVVSGFFTQDDPVGEGVRWMADGQGAARLRDGEEEEEISLEEARRTAKRLGLPIPSPLPGA